MLYSVSLLAELFHLAYRNFNHVRSLSCLQNVKLVGLKLIHFEAQFVNCQVSFIRLSYY